jgi:hypothetical protein
MDKLFMQVGKRSGRENEGKRSLGRSSPKEASLGLFVTSHSPLLNLSFCSVSAINYLRLFLPLESILRLGGFICISAYYGLICLRDIFV